MESFEESDLFKVLPLVGKWGFEVEIDHLGDDCNNPCEPVAGQMVKKWLDSTLKQTGFADG